MSSFERDPEARRDRRLRIFGWCLFAILVTGFVVRAVFDVVNGRIRSDLEGGVGFDVLLLAFPIVGIVLISKVPRSPLGWLLLGIGMTFGATPGAPYARYATITRGGELPGAGLALAIESPSWVVFIGLSGFLLLLFPDGHLPTPRWRWFARVCAVGLVALYVLILFSPNQGVDYDLPQVRNPIAIEALGRSQALVLPFVVFAPVTVVGGAVALIRRRRRTTDPVQRQQLRWLTWAAGVIAAAYVMAFVPQVVFGSEEGSRWGNLLGSIAVATFLLIPITIGFAVLRYRLYDIDVVIKKTVIVGVLVGFVALVYIGLVAGVGALVGSTGNAGLSALAAVVVAILFPPVRARARRLADRLVYGERATPYEVLTAFGGQLAGTYSAEDVLPRIARVLGEGVGAARARVWLRFGEGLREVAAWPRDADGDRPDDLIVPVLHTGEELGALSVAMPPADPMDPTKEDLVRDLAAQTGLVLSNVRLTEELRARLDDLRAAQKRLVNAQDAERKRLERNIHDGAQQQLVALAVRLRLTDQLLHRDLDRAHESLVQLQADTTRALEDLRDLARGIYPPLLADEGLAAALEAQARRATFPVSVDATLDRRYPAEIEAAVYFSCLEGLQNVAKYAEATGAEIRVCTVDGSLVFEVVDDGQGFDPSANGYGTGLQGIADRLGAIDGTLEVESASGRGTTIRGRVPVAPAHEPAHEPVHRGVSV